MGRKDVEELKGRTKRFAWEVIRLVDKLPGRRSTDVIGKQILRSATSIGANYRAACKARSIAEFVSKIHIVVEEADETEYWLELLNLSGAIESIEFEKLHRESSELTAIFVSSEKTARTHRDSMK